MAITYKIIDDFKILLSSEKLYFKQDNGHFIEYEPRLRNQLLLAFEEGRVYTKNIEIYFNGIYEVRDESHIFWAQCIDGKFYDCIPREVQESPCLKDGEFEVVRRIGD